MQQNDVLQPLSEAAKALKEGSIYEHYKGMRYRLLSVGRHSETLEEVVIYRALYGDKDVWVRPLEMFLETITKEGQEVPRFNKIEKSTKTNQIALYLAGNIQKNHENESRVFWTNEDRKMIEQGLNPCSVSFLNPALRTDDLSDQKSVFGRDMTQVFCADVIFVDARERRGLGVGAEMMWAKMNRIPVLTLAPKNSHYHKEEVTLLGVTVQNWMHPFVESLSDEVVEDVEEGVEWLKAFLEEKCTIKGPDSIRAAMDHYQNTQLSNDLPMREIFEKHPELQAKMFQK